VLLKHPAVPADERWQLAQAPAFDWLAERCLLPPPSQPDRAWGALQPWQGKQDVPEVPPA
jgi:hypothetical protein